MKEVKEGKRFTLQTGWIIFFSQCVLVSGNVSCFIPAYDFTDQIRSWILEKFSPFPPFLSSVIFVCFLIFSRFYSRSRNPGAEFRIDLY